MSAVVAVPKESADDHTQLAALVGGKVSLSCLYKELNRILKVRVGVGNMYVALVEQGGFLSFPYYIDEKSPENELDLYPMEGVTAAVIQSRRRRWLVEEPELLETVVGIGPLPADWMGVPVIDRDGAVLGVLAVQSYDDGVRFKAEDAAFMEFGAIQIALALQFHAIDREIAVRRIESLVEDTTELEMIYPGIHKIVATLIPSALENFVIARIDREAGVFKPVFCTEGDEYFVRKDWPLDKGFSGYVASGTGKSFIYEDGVTPIPEGYPMLGHRPCFWLGVPIRLGSYIMGVMITQTYDPEQRITRDEERTLQVICPHIANAIARTELFSSVRVLKK